MDLVCAAVALVVAGTPTAWYLVYIYSRVPYVLGCFDMCIVLGFCLLREHSNHRRSGFLPWRSPPSFPSPFGSTFGLVSSAYLVPSYLRFAPFLIEAANDGGHTVPPG